MFIVSLALQKVKGEPEISTKEAVLSYYTDIERIDKTLIKELRKEYNSILARMKKAINLFVRLTFVQTGNKLFCQI